MNGIVRSFWHGGDLTPLQLLSLRSFIANGHPVELYVYEDIGNVPEGVTLKDARSVMPESMVFAYADGFGKGSFAACSNIFRYRLVHQLGGWWVDTDVVCLAPLRDEPEYLFVTEERRGREDVFGTFLFRAPAGSPFLEYCFQDAEARDRDKIRWTEIGPSLFDAAIRRHNLQDWAASRRMYNPINFDEAPRFFSPEENFDDCRTVHLWNSVWKANDMNVFGEYYKESLFYQLRDKYL